ncbi:MAG: hypothetical protein PWP52_37 [Bacteroidales bacterium]|uniref:flippase n=1 Tax=Methanothermococcus thermolithotrophicus TaxID=2186 RepID=UPI000375A96C|nr:flippase [Methanothermococcus thermolithotrophicus]MDK2977342.1 hypothetical protein [Bacteroidales bacterium]MDK2988333.1 hypothetical protein [Methanothermococcus sp.]
MLKKFKNLKSKKVLNSLRKEGLLKDSFYMIFSNIYSKGASYIFFFLMAYILGTEGFGTLRGVLPILDSLVIFFCSGIPPAMAKFISEYKHDNKSHYNETSWIYGVLNVMLIFSLIGGIFTIFLKYFLGGYYKNLDANIYYIIALTLPFSAFISWNRGVLQGSLKIKELSKTWIAEHTSKIIFSIFLASLIGVMGGILSISLGYIIGGLLGFYFIAKNNLIPKNKIRSFKLMVKNPMVKKVILYSIPIALGTASYRLLSDLDSIFIMSILGPQLNGLYGYASLLSRALFLFASSISIPLIPRIAKTKDVNYFKKAILMNLGIVTPFLFMFLIFSKELLILFFNIDYYESSLSLKILSISAAFMGSYTICAASLQGLGYAKVPLYVISFGVVLNAILNYILVKNIGIVGGAAATLISSFFIFVITLYFTIEKLKVWQFHKK